jgi:hypothetical protein
MSKTDHPLQSNAEGLQTTGILPPLVWQLIKNLELEHLHLSTNRISD